MDGYQSFPFISHLFSKAPHQFGFDWVLSWTFFFFFLNYSSRLDKKCRSAIHHRARKFYASQVYHQSWGESPSANCSIFSNKPFSYFTLESIFFSSHSKQLIPSESFKCNCSSDANHVMKNKEFLLFSFSYLNQDLFTLVF